MKKFAEKTVTEWVGTTCDICGEDMPFEHDHDCHWLNNMNLYHSDQDDDTAGPRFEGEVCRKCYRDKVIPALEAIGCKFGPAREDEE